MADLFLHLPFARRLRLAEGLHPLIGETLTRRPSLVGLGATLPLLPGVERKGMSFFRRLFSSGGEAARWQKQLQSGPVPRVALVRSYLMPVNDLGPMGRLALALGALSHEILEARLAPGMTHVAAGDKAAVERAQARLWLQASVPNTRSLEAEWRGLADLTDGEQQRRTWDHLDAALKNTFSSSPGRDALARWCRGLVAEVAPLEHLGLPPSLGLADHAARAAHFDGNDYINRAQQAINWFVVVANRLGETIAREDFSEAGISAALGGDVLIESDVDADTAKSRWLSWYGDTRVRMLERGRNDKPAFLEGDTRPVHRSNAFTGMMNLADLPPDQLPPELQNPSLPPESAVAPPPPAMTQEVSLAMIEQAAMAAGLPPLPLDASGPLQRSMPTAAPALTQEVSLAMIEEANAAARGFAAPPHTQELSTVDIEGEPSEFTASTLPHEVSALQIESVSPTTVPPTTAPPGNDVQHMPDGLLPLPPPPPMPAMSSASPPPMPPQTQPPSHAPPVAGEDPPRE